LAVQRYGIHPEDEIGFYIQHIKMETPLQGTHSQQQQQPLSSVLINNNNNSTIGTPCTVRVEQSVTSLSISPEANHVVLAAYVDLIHWVTVAFPFVLLTVAV
jgi:hypothetical protein